MLTIFIFLFLKAKRCRTANSEALEAGFGGVGATYSRRGMTDVFPSHKFFVGVGNAVTWREGGGQAQAPRVAWRPRQPDMRHGNTLQIRKWAIV